MLIAISIIVVLGLITIAYTLYVLAQNTGYKNGKYRCHNKYYFYDSEFGWYIYDRDEKISVIPPVELKKSDYVNSEF